MGFVTALYNGLRPVIQSGVFFRSLTQARQSPPQPGVTKYRIVLEDGKTVSQPHSLVILVLTGRPPVVPLCQIS